MMSAVALTGAMLFTGCASDDVAEVDQKLFDGEAVKTSFTLSIGSTKANATRMVADAAQVDELFNGMTDIRIYPALGTITDAYDLTLAKIQLADFASFDMTNVNGKIYNNVTIPVGTTNFLFYGTTQTKGNGELEASDLAALPASTSAITFDLVSINPGKTVTYVNTEGADVLTAINAIDAQIAAQITAANTAADAVGEDFLKAIQKKLRYDVSTTSTPDYKAFAGSSTSIEALVEDLYNTLLASNNTYALAVCTTIRSYFTASTTDPAQVPATVTWTTDPDFPAAALSLPDGAVAVQFVTSAFEYVDPTIDGLVTTPVSNFVKPAELYYTVNTPGMVKDAVWLQDNTSAAATWESTVLPNYTEGAVTAVTRSVILKNQIQYAVGRLDFSARISPTATAFKDSGSGIAGAVDENPQDVDVTAGYDLTGILIGGQKQVDWKFTPVTTADEKTIYDGTFDAAPYTVDDAGYSATAYSLALETETDTPINIALEFVNNGDDFFGKDHGLIAHGTKFYLVAQLDPKDSNANASNQASTGNKVFKQDFTTIAKLTIGENSLKSAYNIIPDLRSPKLEFGLSVNLNWQTGITFTQEF